MSERPEKWDVETDVLIVGSGGGAMTAAIRAHDLGADTLMIEKTDQYGGTTAMGGGVVWIPNSSPDEEPLTWETLKKRGWNTSDTSLADRSLMNASALISLRPLRCCGGYTTRPGCASPLWPNTRTTTPMPRDTCRAAAATTPVPLTENCWVTTS